MFHQKTSRLLQNNFDLLRLLFAGVVCLVHAAYLSDFQTLAWITGVLSSSIAVKAFFVVSGFLIFMSFERSSSLSSYARKRINRIYPAYFVAVIISALALVSVSGNTYSDYFSLLWIKYVAVNLVFLNFLQQTLPGVFESNKLAAVNGALWTLKIEVTFYLSVPLFVYLFRRFSPFPLLVFFYCSSVAYSIGMTAIAERTGSPIYLELSRQLPGQLSYFLSGAFLYYFLPLFERRIVYFLIFAVTTLVVNLSFPLPILEPFALATLVIFFGLYLYVGNFGKYGDFSYGFYILHFPVIQIFINSGWFHESPWLFLVSVILTTFIAAIAMWHLVEKHFLLRGSHYVASVKSAKNSLSGPLKTE